MKNLDSMVGVSAFLAVAKHLSFTTAAQELALGRATVGAQVTALEKRLGVRLLQRSTRAVSLTEAGVAYRTALSGIADQIKEAERAAISHQTEAVGRLRIAAPPDLGPHHLAPVIAQYLQTHPGVSVDLRLSTAAVDLIAGGFDLAIRSALTVEPSLVTRHIGNSPLVVCASPAYLARCGMPAKPQALTVHACLHFSELRWGTVWHFRQGELTLRVPLTPRFECNDGPTLLAAAIAGAGIALGAAFTVGPALRSGALVPVLQDWQLPELPLHAVYPAGRHIAHKVRSFVETLATAFAAHPDLGARLKR